MGGSGRLTGRVALVTGGPSGLGRATAVALAQAGAHVAVSDIDGPGSEQTRQRRDRLQRVEGRRPQRHPMHPAELREKAVRLPDGTERPFPCRVRSVIPAAMDTPMMQRWGIRPHLMMPLWAVAGTVRTLISLDPSAFVPEMQIVPRLEPDFPR